MQESIGKIKDDEKLHKSRARKIILGGSYGLLYAALAYIIAGTRLAFGTHTLGLALLCSAESQVVYLLTGLIASSFTADGGGGIYLAVYIIAFLLRVVLCALCEHDRLASLAPADRLRGIYSSLWHENIFLRMTDAAVCAFLLGLYRLISGGYHYYDLFGAVFSIALTPAAVMLYSWYHKGNRPGVAGYKYLAGTAALLATVSFASRSLTLFGLSVSAFLIFFATLYVTRRSGLLAGSAVGFVAGLAFDPTLSPCFVLSAIAYGLIRRVSPTVGTFAAFFAGMVWALSVNGLDALGALLPGLLLSASAFCGAEHAGLCGSVGQKKDVEGSADSTPTAATASECSGQAVRGCVEDERVAYCEARMRELSESFSSLSELFYELSDRLRRPGLIDIRRMCDGVCDGLCRDCVRREVCWGLEYSTSLDMLSRLCVELNEHGQVCADRLPERIRMRCRSIDLLCDRVNEGFASLTGAVLRSEKMGVLALDYESVSKLLSEAIEEERGEFLQSDEDTERVGRVLLRLGIEPEALVVYGARRKYLSVRGIPPEQVSVDSALLRETLEGALGCRLGEPLIEPDGDRVRLTMRARRLYGVERVSLCAPATEGEVCGDSCVMFESRDDRFCAVLSDGMGTGKEASFTSGLCTTVLSKMLSVGNRAETALRLLGGVLRARGGERESECSATVDLLSVDLVEGEGVLYKCGAAPSFVRRGGDIFKLTAKTVPLGILPALDTQRTTVRLRPGDVVVLLSDGITDTGEGDGAWVADLLAYEWEDSLEHMAEKIIGRAQIGGSRDDLTVMLVRVGFESGLDDG